MAVEKHDYRALFYKQTFENGSAVEIRRLADDVQLAIKDNRSAQERHPRFGKPPPGPDDPVYTSILIDRQMAGDIIEAIQAVHKDIDDWPFYYEERIKKAAADADFAHFLQGAGV